MAHSRLIVLGGVSLTMARINRNALKVGPELMDELERVMIEIGYLDAAPFHRIGLTHRFGLKNEDGPHYLGISKKHGDLSIAIELDTREITGASREELKELFLIATLKCLTHVGRKYQLPYERFDRMLQQTLAARAARQAAAARNVQPAPNATENESRQSLS